MNTVFDNPATAQPVGNVQDEFRALVTGCGAYDLASRSKISVAGKDRVRWLNSMTSNNIRDLAAGRGVYAFLLNPQGRVLADLYAYNRGESLLLDTDSGQTEKLLATLRRYIIMDKVELTEANDQLTALGISGPNTEKVLHAAGIEFGDLAPLQLVDVTCNRFRYPWCEATMGPLPALSYGTRRSTRPGYNRSS